MNIRFENILSFFKDPSEEFISKLQEAFLLAPVEEEFYALSPSYIKEASLNCGLDKLFVDDLLTFNEIFLANQPVIKKMIHLMHLLFWGEQEIEDEILPEFKSIEHTGMIYLILILSSLPHMEKKYRIAKIPPKVMNDTLSDLSIWLKRFYADEGKTGLSKRIFHWLLSHTMAKIFRLGRLQFKFHRFDSKCRVFRNTQNNSVIAFALEGQNIDKEGFISDTATDWKTHLSVEKGMIKGSPINPIGKVVRKNIELSSDEWTEVLFKGDKVLDVHIPEGEPLSPPLCLDSFNRALEFFPLYFPDFVFNAFVCSSWLFDPIFLEILKPNSNITTFYSEFYCVPPHHICTEEVLWRVFGKDKNNISTAPKDTSMKKSIAEHYLKGGIFRESAAFILKDDILYYGSQYYWKTYSTLLL